MSIINHRSQPEGDGTPDRPFIPTPAEMDALMAYAAELLAAGGVTPEHVLSWDPSGTEPGIPVMAAALENYLASGPVPNPDGAPE